VADFENFPSCDIIKHNFNWKIYFSPSSGGEKRGRTQSETLCDLIVKRRIKSKTSVSSIAIKHRQKTLKDDRNRNIIF